MSSWQSATPSPIFVHPEVCHHHTVYVPGVDMPGSDEALALLMAGNQRYIAAKLTHPHETPEWRAEISKGQHPFAAVLGCADSRVPPPLIFDQGLGDLFVIRVAGNVLDDVVLGSIEYAVGHLHTPLVMVLGHTQCGAVAATLEGGELEGHLPSLAMAIQPAVDQVRQMSGDMLDNAIRAHTLMTAERLQVAEPVMSKLVKAGRIQVVAAYYHLDTGVVELL